MTRHEWNAVKAALIRIREGASDETALDCKALYPEWNSENIYSIGDRVRDGDDLYKRRQPQIAPEIYAPHEAPALWLKISLEPGTHDNPIHYGIDMELEEGKYYTEDDILYICTRSTGVPVYNPLRALIGIYVEVVV